MVSTLTTLTNDHRKIIGLREVLPQWEKVELDNKAILFYDSDTIRKVVEVNPFFYQEFDTHIPTANRKTFHNPADNAPLNINILNLTTYAVRFYPVTYNFVFQGRTKHNHRFAVRIHNLSNKRMYHLSNGEDISDTSSMMAWLDTVLYNLSATQQTALNKVKKAPLIKPDFKQGDIFTYQSGRQEYLFGIVCLNANDQSPPALQNKNLLPKDAILVSMFALKHDEPSIDTSLLLQHKLLPPFWITNTWIQQGNMEVIGHSTSPIDHNDFPMGLKLDNDLNYLCWGNVFMQIPSQQEDLVSKFYYELFNNFWGVDLDLIESALNGAVPYHTNDLRHPDNLQARKLLMTSCDLNPQMSYQDFHDLAIAQQ